LDKSGWLSDVEKNTTNFDNSFFVDRREKKGQEPKVTTEKGSGTESDDRFLTPFARKLALLRSEAEALLFDRGFPNDPFQAPEPN
jgi:hypothetical protein